MKTFWIMFLNANTKDGFALATWNLYLKIMEHTEIIIKY